MVKNFTQELFKFIDKLKNQEHFAFSRFSDGEVRVLQNKKLVLTEDTITIDNHVNQRGDKLSINEQKEFDPDKHSWIREKLQEAISFNKQGYYKGISCKCCLSGAHGMTPEEEVKWLIKESKLDAYDEHLSWSNLWLNGNYPLFLEHMLPYFFNYDIVMVVNEKANLNTLPFKVKKTFKVGYNCMINNYDTVEQVKNYIKDNKIKNHLFLFSAGSLSNLLCHELYKFNSINTYIDIGSSLNPFMGCPLDRRYLRQFWANSNEPIMDIKKICQWI